MGFKGWWFTWKKLILKLVTLAASLTSVIELLFNFLPPVNYLPWWAISLLIIIGILFIIMVSWEIKEQLGRRVYDKCDIAGINNYMYHWIEHGGRVAIWTRDISWARDPRIKSLLLEKAKRRELILCMPKSTNLSKELVDAGAEVDIYGASTYEPASRFTIAFFGRDGSRVAVGKMDGNSHIIEEFSADAHPAYHLAADLIALARIHNQQS